MTRDKIAATLMGLACGDTLGYQVEFVTVDSIRRRYGADGVLDYPKGAHWSDDTQMTMALAEGLIDAASAGVDLPKVDKVMPFIARQFVKWSRSPENSRAPGGTCMFGCRELGRGADWRVSGRAGSTGCGTAMRASPVGILYRVLYDIQVVSYAQAICTHASQEAKDAAFAAALSVRLLLDGVKPQQAFAEVYARVHERRHVNLFRLVFPRIDAVNKGEIEPHKAVWPSWTGAEAVASAWLCFLLAKSRDEGYTETVRYAANTDGDSDSIAAIAGSLAGAYWGLGGENGVPESWIERLEDRGRLEDLARRFEEISTSFVF